MSKSTWDPPRGALSIIHRRTIPDILLRSAIINLLSLLAYYHLIRTLSRQGCSCQYPPSLRYAMPILAVFLPELVPVQLCSWLIQHHIGERSWFIDKTSDHNDFEHEKTKAKQKDFALEPSSFIRSWTFRHLALALLNLVPFYFALQAYRERLSMRYHDALYVANLLIDHRNGWAAAAGLISTLSTIIVILYPTGQLRVVQQQHPHQHCSSPSTKSFEKLEEALLQQPSPPPAPVSLRSLRRACKTFCLTPTSSLDPLLIADIFGAALLHQIPLSATNRSSPFSERSHMLALIAVMTPMQLIAVALFEVYLLKRAGYTSPGMIKRKLVYAVVVCVVVWFVSLTLSNQVTTDVLELAEVGRGAVRPWNYRWQVKDRLSSAWNEGGGERVYMG